MRENYLRKYGNRHFKKNGSSEESSFVIEQKKNITYKNSLKLTNHFEKISGNVESCRLPMKSSFHRPQIVISTDNDFMRSKNGYKMKL